MRPLLPSPVYRGPYWELRCASCGALLNMSLSSAKDGSRHLESWSDGCAWVAKYYTRSPRAVRTPHLKATGVLGKFVPREPLPATPGLAAAPKLTRRAKADAKWKAIQNEVIQRWHAGEGLEHIARTVHMSRCVLYGYLRKDGVKGPRPRRRINDFDTQIVELWQGGVTQAAIAAKIGYSTGHLGRRLAVLLRRTHEEGVPSTSTA